MGGCVTRYRELSLTADSVEDVLQPGTVKFYAFNMTEQWLREAKKDVVVRVHVSRLRGVYCARDSPFPKQRRRVWDTERYCRCPSRTCDHAYPNCLNSAGGVCTDCMLHDDYWQRLAHDAALGGLAADQGQLKSAPGEDDDSSGMVELAPGALAIEEEQEDDDTAAIGSGRLFDPPYPHQRDYEFSLRLSPSSLADGPHLSTPGRFFLTIYAAEERVSRALRKQRRNEGEAELHPTLFTVWIEEREPKADPRMGNPERVAQALERAAQRAATIAKRQAQGMHLDKLQEEKASSQAEEAVMREMGLPPDKSKPPASSRAHAVAATAPALQAESKEEVEEDPFA